MTETATCATCPFWQIDEPIALRGLARVAATLRGTALVLDPGGGECRIAHPSVHDNGFPVTVPDDWCGEHPDRTPTVTR